MALLPTGSGSGHRWWPRESRYTGIRAPACISRPTRGELLTSKDAEDSQRVVRQNSVRIAHHNGNVWVRFSHDLTKLLDGHLALVVAFLFFLKGDLFGDGRARVSKQLTVIVTGIFFITPHNGVPLFRQRLDGGAVGTGESQNYLCHVKTRPFLPSE